MSIARYEPWNVMSHLQGEINRIFSNASDANNGAAAAPPLTGRHRWTSTNTRIDSSYLSSCREWTPSPLRSPLITTC